MSERCRSGPAVCLVAEFKAPKLAHGYGHVVRHVAARIRASYGTVLEAEPLRLSARFVRPLDAVRCALGLLDTLRTLNAFKTADHRLLVRIGLASEPAPGGEHQAMKLARFLMTTAAPGTIHLSAAVRDQVEDDVPVAFQRLGMRISRTAEAAVDVFRYKPPAAGRAAPEPQVGGQHLAFPPLPSVIVLPFRSLEPVAAQPPWIDSITSDLSDALARFRDLFVISHQSASQLAEQPLDLRLLIDDLAVRYAVVGAAGMRNRRLRLKVKLHDVVLGQCLWADCLERSVDDLLELQHAIVGAISTALAVKIDAAEEHAGVGDGVGGLQAHGLVLRARRLLLEHNRSSILGARRLCEQAILRHPSHAPAYAVLARTHNLDWRHAWIDDPPRGLDRAVAFARMAIACDDRDARGHGELAFARLYQKNHDAALAAYEKALRRNPNDADLWSELGDCCASIGDYRRGIDSINRAMRLNPLLPDRYLWRLSGIHFLLEDYPASIRIAHRMRNPSEAHRLLAASHAHLGHDSLARRHACMVMDIHPNFSLSHWRNVPPNKDPGSLEGFVAGMRKAGLR